MPFHFGKGNYIVEEVKESLGDIGRYCPNYIVRNAREKGNTMKKPANKELSNLFIQLDNELKVDIEDEQIKEFSETILKFVKGIAQFIELSSGLKFKINPAGSFPLGNKIEHIDEFDFVLEWNDIPKSLTEFSVKEIGNLYFRRGPLKYYPGILIRELLLKCQNVDNITIKTLIQKTFAMNLVISWECSYCHKHEISLDLAVSLKSKNTIHKYLEIMELSFKGTAFEGTIKSHEFAHHCFPFVKEDKPDRIFQPFKECRIDTNYFDKCIFDRCDKISPNIKLSFRITKFICSKIFPRCCKNYKCVLQRTDVCEFEPLISSYVLKQLLLREVIEFPSSKDWSVALIHLRVISLLKRLQNVSDINDILNPLEVKDIRIEKNKFIFEYFDTWIFKLISWFQNGFPERSEDLTILREAKNGSKQLWVLRNVLIITTNEPKILWPEDQIIYPTFKLCISETRSETGNKKNFIYDIYNEIISDMLYVDLTNHDELFFGLFVFLYSTDLGVLEEEDVKSNKVIKKLSIIKEIAETFEITCRTACSVLIKFRSLVLCSDDNVTKMSSVFSQVTMKEAGTIYRFFEQQASRSKKTVFNINKDIADSRITGAVLRDSSPLLQRLNNTDSDDKEISILKKLLEPLDGCCAKHKPCMWLFCAIMKSIGKV